MTVKYEQYLQVLAKSFKQIFEKMSKKRADSYIVKVSKESDASDYAVGVAVPYKDRKDRLSGKFLLGLSDKKRRLTWHRPSPRIAVCQKSPSLTIWPPISFMNL